jgi:hypothetical protein
MRDKPEGAVSRTRTLIELRWRSTHGMHRRFVATNDLETVAREARRRAEQSDVFIGALPRWRAGGDRRSVAGDAPTVWVDLDFEAACALEPVDPAPQLVVASRGPGHLHAFWSRTRTARRVCTSTRTRRTDGSATAVDAAAASGMWDIAPRGGGSSALRAGLQHTLGRL